MIVNSYSVSICKLLAMALLAVILAPGDNLLAAEQPGTEHARSGLDDSESFCAGLAQASPYIPVDSWVYPAVMRLYALGFAKDVYLGMRPWTRASIAHMLDGITSQIQAADEYGDPTTGEAEKLYRALRYELSNQRGPCGLKQGSLQVESVYTATRAISGTSLRDSYHLGSTVINDYGRPYESGFNNYSGASGYLAKGRYLLYVRGEVQTAPSAAGYSSALAQTLSSRDDVPYVDASGAIINQATIPEGPIAATGTGRVIEAYASAQFLNHVFSFGKQDEWLGPGQGGAMAYSNNAENIYAFRINRIEPLRIPLLSRFTGPFRYEFLVGSLKGHTYPNDPWVHVEKISFKPSVNLEFGFERTVIWGGKGHEPITLRTFLRSFFNTYNYDDNIKQTALDPGARFGAFDLSYRLPFLRYWLTFYTDSEAHDQITPVYNLRRSCFRPGLYLSHVPGIPKLDVRAEASTTDSSTSESQGGRFQYYEGIQRQGYTNKGALFGDWIGREDKGGQGWITYHLSGNEWAQVGLRNQKAARDFIPGGTTISDINFQMVKRLRKDLEFNGNFIYERWRAPIYFPGLHAVTATTVQLTWIPGSKANP